MAKTGKVGLDYFSHDVDMLQDFKIKIIRAKHGLVGYAVYLRLLEEIYRDKGYYCNITEDFNILFADDNKIDLNVYINILNDCIEKDLFNKEMYENYKILTSSRIQNNYCEATQRRKNVSFVENYVLICLHDVYNEKVNVNIYKQSKVKESKKKVKEIESKGNRNEIKVNIKESKNDTENINNFFEKVWSMYLKKEGKGRISSSKKKSIYKIKEEFERCVERYNKKIQSEQIEKKYIQNGSTFFNSGYIDYLDINYTSYNEKVNPYVERLKKMQEEESEMKDAEIE